MNKKKLAVNFLILLGVILFLFAVMEIVLRISYPLYSNFNTEMWRYSTEIKTLSLLPGVSHEHIPNQQSTLYGVELKTNSLGFRDEEIDIPKKKKIKRIFLLGDSITLGWGVNQSQIYSEVLQDRLNQRYSADNQTLSGYKYEVINSAVGNYNTEMEVEILKKYLFLQPDAVLVGFFPNDAEPTQIIRPGISYWFKKTFYVYPFLWDRLTKIKFALSSKKYTSRIHQFYTDENGGKERLEQAFAELRIVAEENQLPVYVVVIPQFYNEFTDYDSGYIHEFIAELCAKNNFTCIDLFDKFKNNALNTIVVSPEDAHPNPKGHQIIAEGIFEVMADDI